MSIRGIRNLKSFKDDTLSFYASEEFPRQIEAPVKKNINFGLFKLEVPKITKPFGLFPATKNSTPNSERPLAQVNPFLRKKQYEKFLNQDVVNMKPPSLTPIHLPRQGIDSVRLSAIGVTSFSSRQQRDRSRAQKNNSRISHQGKEQKKFEQVTALARSKFDWQFVVGKGGFGKVWKVKEKKTNRIYAMKQMLKIKVINKKSVQSVLNQKSLLQQLKHPFLVNMSYAFQDREHLYLVIDYIEGGDLRYHVGNRSVFTEEETKFFIACVVLGLQYLHANRIIHRDIKPENLVIDSKGYVRITDLGVSRELRLNNGNDTSGTPGYMAPEVICKGDHSFSADFFAVGVIVFEFMLGRRPYIGRNRQEIREQILAKQVKIDEVPPGWSAESGDFVNRLLRRKPAERLGHNSISEIKNHAWFKDFDWKSLSNKTLKAPFIPNTIEQDYQNFRECISQDTVMENEGQTKLLLKQPETQEMFEGYEYFGERQITKTRVLRDMMVDARTTRLK